MQPLSRKSLIGAFALVASLSAPLAFAQSAEITAQATAAPTETAMQAETSAQGPTAATATKAATDSSAATGAAAVAVAVAAPAKKSWSDVDANKDGKLTKAEAGNVPALSKVFDQADGNADGSLTTDEYKAYVAQVKGGSKAKDGGK